MVQEAEQYKEEDKLHKETIDAKNQLESLLYQTQSSIENPEIKGKLEDEEVSTVETLVKETQLWLDTETDLTKEKYEDKVSEVNGTINSIMMKIYSEGGGSMPEGVSSDTVPQESNGSTLPTVDEVD